MTNMRKHGYLALTCLVMGLVLAFGWSVAAEEGIWEDDEDEVAVEAVEEALDDEWEEGQVLDGITLKNMIFICETLEELDVIDEYKIMSDGEEEDDSPIILRFTSDEIIFLLVSDKQDVHVVCSFEKPGLTRATINEWNRDRRFARAFLTEDKDVRLFSDIGGPGATLENVTLGVVLGVAAIKQFHEQMIEE